MLFIPYQIDYSVQNVSKTIGVSKKRVTFKFGMANHKAIYDDHLSGPACRGSEHEVIFTWTLSNGKRSVLVDGKESHFSESGLNGWTNDREFAHTFTLRIPNSESLSSSNITTPPPPTTTSKMLAIQCVVLSQTVNTQPIPGAVKRPFDLRIQGVSYFSFNKIYELGTPAMVVREGARTLSGSPSKKKPRSRGGGGGDRVDDEQNLSAEERRILAAVKEESMREYQKQQQQREQQLQQQQQANISKPMLQNEPSLLDFSDDSKPPSMTILTNQRSNPFFSSSITMDPSIAGGVGGTAWATSPSNLAGAPTTAYSNYTMDPSTMAPPPTLGSSVTWAAAGGTTQYPSYAQVQPSQLQPGILPQPPLPPRQTLLGGSSGGGNLSIMSSSMGATTMTTTTTASSMGYNPSYPAAASAAQPYTAEWQRHVSAPAATAFSSTTTATTTTSGSGYMPDGFLSSSSSLGYPSTANTNPTSLLGTIPPPVAALNSSSSSNGGYDPYQNTVTAIVPPPLSSYSNQVQGYQPQPSILPAVDTTMNTFSYDPSPMISPSNSTVASYGSAPTFAQPPKSKPALPPQAYPSSSTTSFAQGGGGGYPTTTYY